MIYEYPGLKSEAFNKHLILLGISLVMKKRVFVILGHPNKNSFCGSLADAYIKGARKVAKVRRMDLRDLKFDPVLWEGYNVIQELEPDLILAQENIKWADHIVFIYPTWWGSPPALMKGFVERVFHPSFAFKYKRKNDLLPLPLLRGRSAHLIITMDDFRILDRIIFHKSVVRIMKSSVLLLSGIRPVHVTLFDSVKRRSPKKLKKWIEKVKKKGERGY